MPVLPEGVGYQYGIAVNQSWLAIDDRVGQHRDKQHVHRVNRIVFEFRQVVNIHCVHFLVAKEAGIHLLGRESGRSDLPAPFLIHQLWPPTSMQHET